MHYIYYPRNQDALCHHGIKGQKWGVRRFQNPDGSYTAEGKQRRNVGRTPAEKEKLDAKRLKTAIRDYVDNVKRTEKEYYDYIDKHEKEYRSKEFKDYKHSTLFDKKHSKIDPRTRKIFDKLIDLEEKDLNSMNEYENPQQSKMLAQCESFINKYGHKAFQKDMKSDVGAYYIIMWKTFQEDKIDYDGWNKNLKKYGDFDLIGYWD